MAPSGVRPALLRIGGPNGVFQWAEAGWHDGSCALSPGQHIPVCNVKGFVRPQPGLAGGIRQFDRPRLSWRNLAGQCPKRLENLLRTMILRGKASFLARFLVGPACRGLKEIHDGYRDLLAGELFASFQAVLAGGQSAGRRSENRTQQPLLANAALLLPARHTVAEFNLDCINFLSVGSVSYDRFPFCRYCPFGL